MEVVIMEVVIDGQTVQMDDAEAPLLAAHPWKVRPIGKSKVLRVVWHESFRHENGKRGVSARQFHREMCQGHAGNISFADGNPFNLRRANLVLHTTVVARLENPYDPDELAALYQDHSLEWLCNEASAKLSRAGSVNEEAVRRWLVECHITPRTAGEEQARAYALNRGQRQKWLQKGVQVHAENIRAGLTVNRVDHLHTPEMKQRAKEAYLRTLRPCDCPWPTALLSRYYQANGWSLKTLAVKAARRMGPEQRHPQARDAKRWLLNIGETIRTSAQQRVREAHLRCRRQTASPPKRHQPCPFTAARLRQLYWQQGKSLRSIQTLAAQLLGEGVSQKAVTRWLGEQGLNVRSRQEAAAVRASRDLPLLQNQARLMQDAWRAKFEAGEMPAPTVKSFSLKARRAAVKATKGRKTASRPCALPACAQTITRPLHQFRGENAYCCRSHQMKDQARRRQEDQEQERWEKRLGMARPAKLR